MKNMESSDIALNINVNAQPAVHKQAWENSTVKIIYALDAKKKKVNQVATVKDVLVNFRTVEISIIQALCIAILTFVGLRDAKNVMLVNPAFVKITSAGYVMQREKMEVMNIALIITVKLPGANNLQVKKVDAVQNMTTLNNFLKDKI